MNNAKKIKIKSEIKNKPSDIPLFGYKNEKFLCDIGKQIEI